jgi:DNA-binding transcriptional LysR family regulator
MLTLRLFCDVVRLQSFSLGAKRHHITQSAASQRIGALERQLGITLIDRSVRPLTVTLAGDLYFNEVQELLERYDQLESRITHLGADMAGEVRVDAIYSAGIDLLQKIEQQFQVRYPQVTIATHYRRPEEVYDSVRHRQCDIGIVSYPQTWRGVNWMQLRDETMSVICNPGHPLAMQSSVHASELDRWSMLSFEPTLPLGRHIRRYLRKYDAEPSITNVFDNIDTLKSAVAVTDQIAILPKRTAVREVRAGTLAVVALRPKLTRPLGIIYRRRSGASPQTLPPTVQAFVDFLLEHAGPKVDRAADILALARPQPLAGATV